MMGGSGVWLRFSREGGSRILAPSVGFAAISGLALVVGILVTAPPAAADQARLGRLDAAPVAGASAQSMSPGGSSLARPADAGDSRSARIPMPSPPDPGRGRTYFEHIVQSDELLARIADRYAVSVHSIRSNNAELHDRPEDIPAGMRLLVPARDGLLHPVAAGDTVEALAAKYGVTVEAIVDFPGNGLSDSDSPPVGMLLLVPGGRHPEALSVPTIQPPLAIFAGGLEFTGGWGWPLASRRLTSLFDATHPLGIDLGAPMRSGIYAVAAGHVTFTGGDPCCSYGYFLDIDHGGGVRSRYAHVDEFLVAPGQRVERGQLVALLGNNGRSTGPHLHFEIRLNSVPIDPLAFLAGAAVSPSGRLGIEVDETRYARIEGLVDFLRGPESGPLTQPEDLTTTVGTVSSPVPTIGVPTDPPGPVANTPSAVNGSVAAVPAATASPVIAARLPDDGGADSPSDPSSLAAEEPGIDAPVDIVAPIMTAGPASAAAATPTPTTTAAATATPEPTAAATLAPAAAATATPEPTATATPATAEVTPTAEPTPTATPAAMTGSTATSEGTATPEPTPAPIATPESTPTASPAITTAIATPEETPPTSSQTSAATEAPAPTP